MQPKTILGLCDYSIINISVQTRILVYFLMAVEFSQFSIKMAPEQLKMVATEDQPDIPTCIFPLRNKEINK